MRAPAFGAAPEKLYRAAIEQSAWADALGFHYVSLSEHHGAEDGYLPSPLVLGGAIAAVTKNVRIQFTVLVITLHDPLRVAEDVAVLDLISGGRVELHLGSGYRAEEFAMFGKDLGQRAATMEAILPLLEKAWSGEPFEHHGVEVLVTPRPRQRPRPPVFFGGQTLAAARRAARLGDGFMPASPDPSVGQEYVAERERLGLPPGRLLKGSGALFLHVAEDPDAAWAKIAPHALHDSNSYLGWSRQGPKNPFSVLEDADSLRASGVYRVVTPDECLELALAKGPDEPMGFHPLMGGLDPAIGWESLELVASKVLPHLQEAGVLDGSRVPAATSNGG